MAKGEQYEARVEAWITPVLEQHQFELVDVEYVREVGVWYLRCYIDKEGGITVDDCEVISRLLGEWLDKEDFIEDRVASTKTVRSAGSRKTSMLFEYASWKLLWEW